MWISAQSGHINAIIALKNGGADVNIPNNNGSTPVWIAAQNGHVNAITALKNGGADVNKPNNKGITPVWIAAHNGHVNAITALIDGGADVNIPDIYGHTALSIIAPIFGAILSNKNAGEAVVTLIAEKTCDANLIKEAVKKDTAGEGTYAAAVANVKINQDTLVDICTKTSALSTLNQCIKHPLAKAAVFKAYLSRIDPMDSKINHYIVNKSMDTTVLSALLTKLTDNDDALMQTIAKHSATDNALLGEVVKKMVVAKNFKTMAKLMLECKSSLTPNENNNEMDFSSLSASIDKLRLKALLFLDTKDTADHNYHKASQAAFSLYVLLNHATTDYVNGKIDHGTFQSIVRQSIEYYRPVLETHRGMKGILLGIINSVVVSVNASLGTKFSEFKLKTQSLKLIEDIDAKSMPRIQYLVNIQYE